MVFIQVKREICSGCDQEVQKTLDNESFCTHCDWIDDKEFISGVD